MASGLPDATMANGNHAHRCNPRARGRDRSGVTATDAESSLLSINGPVVKPLLFSPPRKYASQSRLEDTRHQTLSLRPDLQECGPAFANWRSGIVPSRHSQG